MGFFLINGFWIKKHFFNIKSIISQLQKSKKKKILAIKKNLKTLRNTISIFCYKLIFKNLIKLISVFYIFDFPSILSYIICI